jgi:transcriptional regulator with XRE-family HTH domain
VEQGEVLRTAREAAGVGLREMARAIHYSPTYLSYIESGKRPAAARVVQAYEDMLGAGVDRLASVVEAPRTVDRESLDQVATMLSAVRRLEDVNGAETVLPAV